MGLLLQFESASLRDACSYSLENPTILVGLWKVCLFEAILIQKEILSMAINYTQIECSALVKTSKRFILFNPICSVGLLGNQCRHLGEVRSL